MAEPIIRLHVGAHKTASSYMQGLLNLNRAQSAANDVVYWSLRTVRPVIESAIKANLQNRTSGISRLFKPTRAAEQSLQRIRDWFSLGLPTTISEENILGDTQAFYTGTFYPRAEERLQILKSALPTWRMELFLCIRSYPDFLSSVYGQSLRHGSFMPLDDFTRAHSVPNGQWCKVINVLRSVFPQAELVVWPYESFRKLEPTIISRLSGIEYGDLTRLEGVNIRPSASAEAIERMIEAAPSLSRQARAFKMLALQHKFPLGPHAKQFDPWTAHQRKAMQSAYEDDLSEIEKRKDVTFLRN